jgi:tRNA (adenine57-N1/adenine58-N1)-methyltransferase
LTKDLIADGDYVLIYLDARRTYMIKVQSGQTFHTHKGYLKLDDLIGKEYGNPSKAASESPSPHSNPNSPTT